MSAKGIILVALVAVALLSSVSEARKHAKLRIHQKNTAENEAIKPHASQDETLPEQKMDLVVDDHKVGEVKELQTGAMSCANITCQNGGYCLETGSGEPHCLCFRFYTGQYCQLTSAVNVALSDRSTTCTASGSPDDCYNVIDGILLGDDWFVDAGDIWIELDFGEFRYMVALQIRQRCNQNNQNRGITLTYSDGFQQSIELACHNSGFNDTVCENTYWQHFDLELRMTRSLRFTVDTVCNQTAINRANGFKEIKVYAYEVGVTNIALESYGSTCTASSEYNNLEFNCEQAMDGVIEPGPGNEWASNNEGAGAWIEMSFPGNFGIYSIGLLPRCAAAAQILQVTATFSTGRELVFDLVCNGGGNPYDCDGQDFQRFMFATPEDSNNLRLTITTICEGIEADHGFREIEVLAIKLSSASELSAIELDSRLACSNITCENGGTCVVTSGGFPQCVCSRFYTGTYCQTSALLDVARSVLAATCIASSQPGSCTNALDSFPGGEGWYTNLGEVNSWIEIDFGEFYYIIALQIRQLCNGDDQISAISVRFSDFEQTIQVACHNISTGDSECENTYWQNFDLETRMSRSLRIDVIEVCRGNNYIGLREIKVFGYDTALINIAALSYGSNCTASSQYNPDELNCQAALDGKTDPADPPSEWASNGEGAGAWIQVNFPGQFKIYQIGLLPRCKADIQQVTAVFDKDRTAVFNLTCNGGQHMYDCDGQEFQQFPLASPLESTFVRLTISSICDVQANHGFREIHVYGMKSVTIAADAEVRLVDGDDQYEGRVEFIYEGVWGTVCDDSWDSLDAQVVCRELGYSGGQPFGSAYFGQGSDPIWLDDVNCAGTEERLSECPHRGIGSHNCGHYEDAGVRCQP